MSVSNLAKKSSARIKDFVDEVVEAAALVDDMAEQRIANALMKVPREAFVHSSLAEYAYEDRALPLGGGRCLMKPSIFVRMLGLCRARKDQTILELGPGSCYGSAVLHAMGLHVYALEEVALLSRQARKLLDALDLMDVLVRGGPLEKGWAEHAPFDLIVSSTVLPEVPGQVLRQLATGGLFVGAVGDKFVQQLTIIEKRDDENVSVMQLDECSIFAGAIE